MTAADAARFLSGPGRPALARFLSRQRWFAARGRGPSAVEIAGWAAVGERPSILLTLVTADDERYYMPVAVSARATAPSLDPAAEIDTSGDAVLYDAHLEPELGRRLLVAIATGAVLAGPGARFEGHTPGPWTGPTPEEAKEIDVRATGADQSNTSLRLGRQFLLKSIRRPTAGLNPEFEVSHFLATRSGFTGTPGLAGWIDHVEAGGARSTVALLQPWIDHEGDGWSWALGSLRALANQISGEPVPPAAAGIESRMRELAGDFAASIGELGAVTAGLHLALASGESGDAFAPEPITRDDADGWARNIASEAARTVALVEERRRDWPPEAAAALSALVAAGPTLAARTAPLRLLSEGGVYRIRTHGDYHLGQVLRTHGTFAVVDFEGEPARPLPERRAKHAALRDVAGMLRSFGYAAHTAVRERPPAERPALGRWLDVWEHIVREDFRRSYLAGLGETPTRLVPAGDQPTRAVSAVFELEKALYEVRYELAHRPDWVAIPLAGLSRMMAAS